MRAFAVGLVAALVIATAPLAAAQAATQQEKPKEAAPATDAITGDWTGTVVLPDGPFPFFLKLKLEKDKVTGEVGSEHGSTPLSGTYVEGKLALAFVYVTGDAVTMTGDLKEDQLSGQLDLGGGQMQATWSASRKKA
ncbi:MAG TPA: hypothetical protein VK911_11795 [Vicinamibacterales bacterium]|nr:hypothetical protein [Vicinamibacterales bacterium]